jgi:hypothetical protein
MKDDQNQPEGAKVPATKPSAEEIANIAVQPDASAAVAMALYSKHMGLKEEDMGELMLKLLKDTKEVWAGDMKRAEAMLFNQAHVLQAIFSNLAAKATRQEYLKHWEAYLRMALKAQNQCRMTLETLAAIKNPPVVFARQANINNGGQQQVNNGVPAPNAQASTHAANSKNPQTELLEQQHGQGLDLGAQGQAGRADPHVEAVGTVHRPAKR